MRRVNYSAAPQELRFEDCYFYHTLDLPSGAVGGDWDLRATIDAYLGHYDFAGKRVLDVGTAGGQLAFEAEARGAREVVAFDIASGAQWDHLELPNEQVRDNLRSRRMTQVEAVRNGFWWAHRELGSSVKRFDGSLYDLPADIGRFDVAIMGMMLPHIRDPLLALAHVGQRTDAFVITQQMPGMPGPWAYFIPTRENKVHSAWWSMSRDCIAAYLDVLGFDIVHEETARHSCPFRDDDEECTALVARRQ
jgi:SAM-dependent methyltransferase